MTRRVRRLGLQVLLWAAPLGAALALCALVAAVVLMLLGVRFGRPVGVRGLLVAAAALVALSLLFRPRR